MGLAILSGHFASKPPVQYNNVRIKHKNGQVSTMADFMDFPTARERVLTCGDTIIGIIPEICLVSHFQVGAWPVLYRPAETGNVKRWGMPLMIPNFSRLKDGIFRDKNTTLPVHGFGRNLPWTVVSAQAAQSTTLSMQLNSSDATRPSYPYEFTFTATISVGESTLTYTLVMENHSDEPMPIAPGFHPYFTVAQQDKPQLVADGPSDFEAQAFDWEHTPPDNPYPFPHRVSIQVPRHGALTIEEMPVDGQYVLANMQVWSEPATKPDAAFVCFEPSVGSEDVLNRPADRLTVPAHSLRQLILQLSAKPLSPATI
jgi:galactose mutarotase-like enzyme